MTPPPRSSARERTWKSINGATSATDPSSTSDLDSPDTSQNILKAEMASGIIISALGDSPLRVVLDAGDNPKKMLKLLGARYASNRTVSRIATQTQIFRMKYNRQNMTEYIDEYTYLYSQLERMGDQVAIPE